MSYGFYEVKLEKPEPIYYTDELFDVLGDAFNYFEEWGGGMISATIDQLLDAIAKCEDQETVEQLEKMIEVAERKDNHGIANIYVL